MTQPFVQNGPDCPRCGCNDMVFMKLLLDRNSPDPERSGVLRSGHLACDELVSPPATDDNLRQFVRGVHCSRCDIRFMPDEAAIQTCRPGAK